MSQVLPACWITCPSPDDHELTEPGEQAGPVGAGDLAAELQRARLEIVGSDAPRVERARGLDRSVLASAALGYVIGGPIGGLVAAGVASRLAASEAAAPPSAPDQRAHLQGW